MSDNSIKSPPMNATTSKTTVPKVNKTRRVTFRLDPDVNAAIEQRESNQAIHMSKFMNRVLRDLMRGEMTKSMKNLAPQFHQTA